MIASAHIAAGLVAGMAGPRLAGRRVVQVAAAFAIGLASHVALDAIPHADYLFLGRSAIAKLIVAEGIAMAAIAASVLRRRVRPGWRWPMFAGVAGATIPDVKFLTNIVLPTGPANAVADLGNQFHSWFHAHSAPLTLSVMTQVVSVVLLVAVLFAFPRVRDGT